jgi:hypothetical protein
MSRVSASNQVRIGNNSVSSIGGQVSWTVLSDSRIKEQVRENVPGLSFIKELRPVTYRLNVEKQNRLLGMEKPVNSLQEEEIEKIVFTGFLAQEVESASEKIGYNFSGVDKSGAVWGLRYSAFVVPLVKGMQEQQAQIEALQELLEMSTDRIARLEGQIESLAHLLEQKGKEGFHVNEILENNPWLGQNIPNPFDNETIIPYSLPEKFQQAQILIFDGSGRLVQKKEVATTGKGTFRVPVDALSQGVYTYALMVDGLLVDSKKMVKSW